MITLNVFWQCQSFDVVALTLPTDEIAAPHTAPKMLLWSLSEPIFATIEGGENTRDGHNARALLVEIA